MQRFLVLYRLEKVNYLLSNYENEEQNERGLIYKKFPEIWFFLYRSELRLRFRNQHHAGFGTRHVTSMRHNVKKNRSTRDRHSNKNRDNSSLGETQASPALEQRYEMLTLQAKHMNIVFHQKKFSLQPSPDTVDKPWQLMYNNKNYSNL